MVMAVGQDRGLRLRRDFAQDFRQQFAAVALNALGAEHQWCVVGDERYKRCEGFPKMLRRDDDQYGVGLRGVLEIAGGANGFGKRDAWQEKLVLACPDNGIDNG
jgi:hypothetical protein